MSYPHVSAHPRKAPQPILAAPLLQQRQTERTNYPAFLSTVPVDDQDDCRPVNATAKRSLIAAAFAPVLSVAHLLSHLLGAQPE